MSKMQASRHRQVWIGLLFFLVGFCGEGTSGILLLPLIYRQVYQQVGPGLLLLLLLLHVLAVLIWALGIDLLCNRLQHPHRRTFVNKWAVGALLLGLFTFPGSGMLMYSVAGAVAILLQRRKRDVPQELEPVAENILVPEAVSQLTMDDLQGMDIEAKRLAVATLSRQGTPEAMRVLRQLLLDPQAVIRTDASIVLTHLEERLSRSLNAALEQWTKNPSDRESTLNLADQYYQYAQSNVLDEESQRFYLLKAHDLWQRMITEGAAGADLWLKLARVRQRLNKCTEALRDVRVAIQLNPHMSEAYALAMELAFALCDWDGLVSFARQGVNAVPETSELSESLQWWATLQVQQEGEAVHA